MYMPNLIATSSITINAPAHKVWDALTNPVMIKQYLFGTEAVSDWKVGSPIVYQGVWEDTPYEDRGQIVEVVPEKLLVTTYWSNLSGKADLPENYNRVAYELSPTDGGTMVTITQDNNPTEESKKHSEQNWQTVLTGLKKLLEQT